MRPTKSIKTLVLNRETLRLLTDSDLRHAAGGVTALTICPLDATTTCCTIHIGCGVNTSPGN